MNATLHVEVDRSGQGSCWTPVDMDDLPAQVREEIEGEAIGSDGRPSGELVASNGTAYRWRTLIPHDGVSEVYVCRECGEQADPTNSAADCTDGRCPTCGGHDTAWLWAD